MSTKPSVLKILDICKRGRHIRLVQQTRKHALLIPLCLILFSCKHKKQENDSILSSKASPIKTQIVLDTHVDTYHWLEQINLTHLKGLRECFCLVSDDLSCQSDDRSSFEYIFINGKGSERIKEFKCKEAAEKYLTDRIPSDLKKARTHLILASSGRSLLRARDLYINNQGLTRYLNRNISHLIEIDYLEDKMIEPATDEELNEAATELGAFADNTCSAYLDNLPGEIALNLGLKGKECSYFIERISGHHQRGTMEWTIQTDFRTYTFDALKEFRNQHKLSYLKTIKYDPLILPIRTESVNNAKILNSLNLAISNARNRLNRAVNPTAKWFVENLWVLPYTKTILSVKFPEENFEDEINNLLSHGKNMKTLFTGLEIGGLIGGFVACNFIPAGRVVKVIAMTIPAVKVCSIAFGLSVSSFMLTRAIFKYEELNSLLVSTFESTKVPFDLKEYNPVRIEVALGIALFALI